MDDGASSSSGALASWQPRSAGNGPPVAFRLGALGLGAGAGCGVGLGFGRPLAITSIPLTGQAAQGMAAGLGAGLGGAGAAVQAAAAAARRRVQGLGVPHLDAGFGCGVGVGYGFFVAGLMVRPSVLERLQSGARELAGALSCVVGRVQGWLGGQGSIGARKHQLQ
jgi:hypothetical protein